MKNKLLLLAFASLFVISGCKTFQTAYFGVKDKAIFTPPDFAHTVETINAAKQNADAPYQKKKVEEAMQTGQNASVIYWACHDELAKAILANARLAALEGEMYHLLPPPPATNRASETIPPPVAPGSLYPDQPFAGISALPPAMTLETVHFAFNTSKLSPPAKTLLKKDEPIIKGHTLYEIAGHTDSVGSDSYNQRLSERRAASVKRYLASKGVPQKKMVVVGYGKSEPIASNGSPVGQKINRRAEIRVIPPLFPRESFADFQALPPGTTIEMVNFSFASNKLHPVYKTLLNRLVPVLRQNKGARIELAGFTDNTGSAAVNVRLSKRRAQIVARYFSSKGISPRRMVIKGFGEENPIVPNDAIQHRALNRRVEIRIYK